MMARIGWGAVTLVCALAFWVALNWGGEDVGLVRALLIMLFAVSTHHAAGKV